MSLRNRSESLVDDEDDDYKYSDDSFVSDEEPPPRTKSDGRARQKINPASRKTNVKGKGRGRGTGKQSRAQSETPRVDPVIQRVLSARKLKINELRNQVEEINRHMIDMKEENKLLKKTQRRQERALERFEDTESDLPQIMQKHTSEIFALKEQLRKTKDKYNRTDRYLRDAEDELEKVKNKLKKYKAVADENNLMERDELSKKVQKYELDLEEKEVRIRELEKHVQHLNKNHRHEIGIEMARNRESKKHLEDVREENSKLEQQLKEKMKELEMKNIYANRMNQSHSVPVSYGGTPRDSPRNRRKRRPSLHEITPREKARQFEEKRREELRLRKERKAVPRLSYNYQEDDEDDVYQPKSPSKPVFKFRSLERNTDYSGYNKKKETRLKYAPKSEPLRPSKAKGSTKPPLFKSTHKSNKSSRLEHDVITSKPSWNMEDSDGYQPSSFEDNSSVHPRRSYDNNNNNDDHLKRPWESERRGKSDWKNDSPRYNNSPKFDFSSNSQYETSPKFETSPRFEAGSKSRKKWPWEKDNPSEYGSNVRGTALPTDDGLSFGEDNSSSSKSYAVGDITSTYDSGNRFGRTTVHKSSAMGVVTSSTATAKPGRQLQEKARQDRDAREREEKQHQEHEAAERQRRYEMEEKERREEEERRERQEQENRERERRRREEEDRRRLEEDERREAEEWNLKMQREKMKREAEERKREAEEREREERARRDREREEQERRAHEEKERMKMDAQLEEERRKKDALLAKLREIDEGGGATGEKSKKDHTHGNFFLTKSNSDAGSTTSSKHSYSFSRPIENLHNGMPSQEVSIPYIEKQKKRKEKEEETGYMPSFGSSRTGHKTSTKKQTGGGAVIFNDEFAKPPIGKSKVNKKNDLMTELFGSQSTADKSNKNDDDIFSSGNKLNTQKTTKISGFPWDDEPKSTTTKTLNRQRDSSSSALFGGGSALLDDDATTNESSKLLPRRQRQTSTTFQSRPAVTAVDHLDDDIEEVIL